MNREAVLSGAAGLAGVQWALQGQSSRRKLRSEIHEMLPPGCPIGPLQLTRAKFKPNRRINAFYTLTVGDGAGGRTLPLAVTWTPAANGSDAASAEDEEALLCAMQEEAQRRGLMAPFSKLWRDNPGWGIRVMAWPLDPKFAQLARMGDPHYTLQALGRAGVSPAFEPASVQVTPIRYRPGERHVLRFDLLAPGRQGQRVYAKVYKSAAAAGRTFRVAKRVVDWLDAHPEAARGVRPVGWSEDDAMILYPHAAGVPLSEQLHRSPGWLGAQLRRVGETLFILHNGPASLADELEQDTLEKEIKVIRRASEHVQVLLPEAAKRLFALLDRAQELHDRLPQDDPTFTHSDFKCDHLLADADGLALIDFDTCSLADPALDVGKYLADLEWWFELTHTPQVERAQAEFLKGYGLEDGNGRISRARIYQALILSKITLRRAKLFSNDWAGQTQRMIARAEEIIRQL